MKQLEITDYDILRLEDGKLFKRLKRLQQNFTKSFPIEKIKTLKLDDYVVGKSSKKSFCYRIETELQSLGNMKGSNSAKFGIYYGIKGKDKEIKYRHTKKYGEDTEIAFQNVRTEIIKLLVAGKEHNNVGIINSKIAALFRYKIIGTYYPDQYLNVYSKEHLDYFIAELGINSTEKSILSKQNHLLEFKNKNSISKEWTNFEFSRFLYEKIGRPPKDETNKKKIQLLPPLENVNLQEVNIEAVNYESKTALSASKGKVDHVKQNLRNTQLGKRGENLVFNFEIELAHKLKLDTSKIEHTSKLNDRAGYDIKSIDEFGNTKYIEVKATRSKPGLLQFNITENEIQKSKALDNYFIYVVFEASTTRPKLWRMKKCFKDYLDEFKLIPVSYKIRLDTSEVEGHNSSTAKNTLK